MAFVHEQHDGYVDYQTLPVIPLASQKQLLLLEVGSWLTSNRSILICSSMVDRNTMHKIRPQSVWSLLWNITPDLKWNVAYEKFADRGTPSMNLMQTPRAGQKLWSALIDTAPFVQRDTDSLRSRLDYKVSNDVSLSYIAGVSKFSGSSNFDQDGGVAIPTSFATGCRLSSQ